MALGSRELRGATCTTTTIARVSTIQMMFTVISNDLGCCVRKRRTDRDMSLMQCDSSPSPQLAQTCHGARPDRQCQCPLSLAPQYASLLMLLAEHGPCGSSMCGKAMFHRCPWSRRVYPWDRANGQNVSHPAYISDGPCGVLITHLSRSPSASSESLKPTGYTM